TLVLLAPVESWATPAGPTPCDTAARRAETNNPTARTTLTPSDTNANRRQRIFLYVPAKTHPCKLKNESFLDPVAWPPRKAPGAFYRETPEEKATRLTSRTRASLTVP